MNKFSRTTLAAACLCLFAPATGVLAEDTDIYAVSGATAAKPNVLIILDNSANWSSADQGWLIGKQGQAELNALRTVGCELTGNTNLSLMMFTPQNKGQNNVDGDGPLGGYIRWSMRPMSGACGTSPSGNRGAWQAMIGDATACIDGTNTLNGTPNCIAKNYDSMAEKVNANSTSYSAAMFEAFKYFGGYTSPAHASDDVAGTPQNSTHFGTWRYATLDPNKDVSAYSTDRLSYRSPSQATNCGKNYIILIGNGYPSNHSTPELLAGVGGDTSPIEAPDLIKMAGAVPTLLQPANTTGIYASKGACETAAAATYGTTYNSYTCNSTGTAGPATTLSTSSCGQYSSQSACETAARQIYGAQYGSYSCSVAGSCSTTSSLGTSACGAYNSAAECQAALPSLFPDYSGFTCTLASACASSTTPLGSYAAGLYPNAAACQAAAAADWPGYASYSCAGTSASVNLGSTLNLGDIMSTNYASQSNCTAAAAAAFPGYTGISCSNPVPDTAHQIMPPASKLPICGSTNAYSGSSCAANAPALLGGTYATYTCNFATNTTTCPGSKEWTITGTNNSYTVTGSATPWAVSGTNPGGSRYTMTGTGGKTYTITGANPVWQTYGNTNIEVYYPTGTTNSTTPDYADDWARFLNQTDINSAPLQQTATTYTINVFKNHPDPDQTRLLMNMATVGGGKYFQATDEDGIKDALRKILAEIQSVNSVFASSSLPVSVNTQGTYLNQVFMGMFRPKGDATPRWMGNLKQYQFAQIGGVLRLADKIGDQAINPLTGFIDPCVDSFWSTDTLKYWSFSTSSRGGCTAQKTAAGLTATWSDAPDGDVVEKGGAAQKLRGTTYSGSTIVTSTNYQTRNLKTCDGSTPTSCTSLANFDANNNTLTPAALGITGYPTPYQNTFIDWVRGRDVVDNTGTRERTAAPNDEVRPSVHGGVVHAQPAVVDYGGTTGVVAFYGSDDGVFHAINGKQTDADGNEYWGFIAPEHYGILKRLRDNSPLLDLPNITGTVAPKDYAFDGGIGVYQRGGTVWIFPAQRRGGRAIYAFDVSTPTSPALKWRRGCFTSSVSDDTMCSSGWSAIGQTWSKPVVSYLSGYLTGAIGGVPKPVLIFGGGYDTCEDTNSQTRCATAPRKGANIWFVDANTGSVIRTYPTNFSVPGDVTVVTDGNGFATHVYAGDTGGNVYRINVGSYDGTTLANWSANSAPANINIASLSETGQARKFLSGPSVVTYSGFNAVLIGSGDREHPLKTDYSCMNGPQNGTYLGVTNQFFMLIDKPNAYPATPALATDLADVTSTTATFDQATTTIITAAGNSSTQGWKFSFGACEQSVNKALVIAGVTYFGTNSPILDDSALNACQINLGIARGYAVDFLTGNPTEVGSPRSIVYQGGGMPPSPVAGVVDLGGGVRQPFCIGCAKKPCNSALEGCKVDIEPKGNRIRSYWYIEKD